jgi:hypothetical protein
MLARVKSGALRGVDAYLVEVEVDLAYGMSSFTTVGLPEVAVKERRLAGRPEELRHFGGRITSIWPR